MDENHPHNYDCAMCGEPCLISGHEGCTRSPSGFCVRTVRCWDHKLKTYRAVTAPVVPTVTRKIDAPQRSFTPNTDWSTPTEWGYDRKPIKQKWGIPEKREKATPAPKATPVNVEKIDPDLAALIEGASEKSDETIRERLEKGSV